MAKMIQFEGGESGGGRQSPACLECETNLTDALDGTLSTAEQARFDAHIAGCSACSQMFSEATRGAAWLEMLRTPRPEPSAALLERILSLTGSQVGDQFSDQINNQASDAGLARWDDTTVPAWPAYGLPVVAQPFARQQFPSQPVAGHVLPFPARLSVGARIMRQNMLQPRLAMTAAMAFFSIALTLNLSGVRVDQLHASDLTPSGIRRGFYDASASAARYYGNLKVVYVMESRLEEIRRNRDDDPNHPDGGMDGGNSTTAQPSQTDPQPNRQTAPAQKHAPDDGNGTHLPPTSGRDNSTPHFQPISREVFDLGNSGRMSTTRSTGQLQTSTSTMPPPAGLEYERTGEE